MAGFEPLLTGRLILTRLTRGDRDAFNAYRSLPEVMLYQGFRPKALADADTFIAKLAPVPGIHETWFQLAVCRREDGRLIGDIGIYFNMYDECAYIGYTLSPDCWGRGYISEALPAVLDFLFHACAMHRAAAVVDPRNARSVRVVESLGMRREAYRVQSHIQDGQPADECLYAILREEWEGRAAPGRP